MLRRSETWILIAIMLTAAFLRSEYLLQIEHNIDHAYPVWQALQTIEHGELPLTGQSTSVLFANPALTGYLYLPLIALTRSPLGAYILVIALNTLAVLLAFRAVRTAIGVRPALIAAALMAVNPWVIEYSRAAWVQSLLPFFACAIAWLLWPVLLGRSRRPARRTLLALLMLTLMSQTYLLAFLMAIPVCVLLFIFRQRVPRRGMLLGAAVFACGVIIYGGALWTQREAVQARLGEFSTNPASLSGEAWGHAVRLVSGSDYALVRGQDAPIDDWALREDLSQVAHYGLFAALLIGIGFATLRIIRGQNINRLLNAVHVTRDSAVILLIWFGMPILLMSYVGQPVHPFYQLLGLPAGYALAAWGLSAVFRPHSRMGGTILLVIWLPFAGLSGLNSARYFQETAAHPGAHSTGALPLDYGLRLGQMITQQLSEGGIVYADEAQWTLNSFAGTTFPVVRDARAPEFNVVPYNGGLYIAAFPPETTPSIMPAPATRAEALTLPDGWQITMDVFAPNATQQIAITHPLERTSEEGITFLGYDLSADNTLTTYWRIDTVSGDTTDWLFAPFVHIFDEAGARVSIVDGALVPGNEWHAGDVHIHRIAIPMPGTGAYTISVGQYHSVNQRNVIFHPDYTALIPLPSVLSSD